jgi:hypothetical protein
VKRAKYGNKWESSVQICGVRVYLGAFEYRSDAVKAEAIAIKIRDAISTATLIRKKQSKDISFPNPSEQAA